MSQPSRQDIDAVLAELRAGFGVGSNRELLHLLTALGRVVLQESVIDDRGRRVLRIVTHGGRERQIVIDPD